LLERFRGEKTSAVLYACKGASCIITALALANRSASLKIAWCWLGRAKSFLRLESGTLLSLVTNLGHRKRKPIAVAQLKSSGSGHANRSN
jgi:hypothetical protein